MAISQNINSVIKKISRKGGGTTSLKFHLKSKYSDKHEELLLLEKDKQQKTQQLTPLQECKIQLLIVNSLKNRGVWNDRNRPLSS